MNNKQIAISLQFVLLGMCVFYGPEYFSSQNYFLYMISDSKNVQYIDKYQYLYSPIVACNLQTRVAIVSVSQWKR